MSEKYLFLCTYGCGEVSLDKLKSFEDPEENPNLCCPCGNDTFFIVPNDKEDQDE